MAFSNDYLLNVDIKNTYSISTPTFRQGDNGTLRFKIFDGNKLFDLTGLTDAKVVCKLPSEQTFEGIATLNNKKEIVYNLSPEIETSEEGYVEVILSVYSGDSVVSVQPFNIYMYDSNLSRDTQDVNILKGLIQEVQILKVQVDTALTEVNQAISEVNGLKTELQDIFDSEAQRELNEAQRITNEVTRESNEKTRLSNEVQRELNEQKRLDDEVQRKSNEVIRESNEQIRKSDEQIRTSAETSRKEHEVTRESNEKTRLSNEVQRKSNEAIREEHETVRESNEVKRELDETKRESNEQKRISSETVREEHEIVRQEQFEQNQATIDRLIPLVENVENKESWSISTQYKKNNIVEFNGSSYMALRDNIGKPPPTLPIKSNLDWSLLAQKGVDGDGGTVNAVNGINPDVTGNVTINSSSVGAIPLSEKGVANGVAKLNASGKVVDALGNEVEGKVTSVNTKIGDVVLSASDVGTYTTNQIDNKIDILSEEYDMTVTQFDGNTRPIQVKYTRKDSTLYLQVDASNPNGEGLYQTLTAMYYSTDGTVLDKTLVWTLVYNEDGLITSRTWVEE